MKKLLALLLALVMVLGLFAGCTKENPEETTSSTAPTTEQGSDPTEPSTEPTGDDYTGDESLVIAYDPFSEKFSPYYADSGYDQDVVSLVSLGLLSTDREGAIVMNGIEGEVRPYNGVDYTYYGASNLVITQNDDGSVDYDITMRDDLVWSDGTPITIDDVLFSMYSLADPTYDGSSTFYALPIEGMEEYRSSMTSKMNYILSLGEGATELGSVTQEEYDAFWTAFYAGGEKFAQSIIDFVLEEYGAD